MMWIKGHAMNGSTQGNTVALVVCAWCRPHDRPHGVVRPHDSGQWQPVSYAFVRAATQGALASQGLCSGCGRIISEMYGLDLSR